MIKIDKINIADDNPCFIIAEAGVNHNGDINLAYKLIDAAITSGADAIKFQTYKTENLVTRDAQKAAYQKNYTNEDESQFEMLKKLELSENAFINIQKYCKNNNIIFLSSPFDHESIQFLESLEISAYKVPSGEITNSSYLIEIAKKQKPVILSTGMSTLEEVRSAVDIFRKNNNENIVLLHCISNYPADPKDVNLRAMKTLEKTFNLPVGFSDHTSGIEIPLAARALGACIIEKHFTLDNDLEGPDHAASLEPGKFAEMVKGIRKIEMALGNGEKKPTANELTIAKSVRKSLVANKNINAGTVLEKSMIDIKRPGTGLSPDLLEFIVGKEIIVGVEEGTLFNMEMFK